MGDFPLTFPFALGGSPVGASYVGGSPTILGASAAPVIGEFVSSPPPSDRVIRLAEEAYVMGAAGLGLAAGDVVDGRTGAIVVGLGAAAWAARRAKRD